MVLNREVAHIPRTKAQSFKWLLHASETGTAAALCALAMPLQVILKGELPKGGVKFAAFECDQNIPFLFAPLLV